MGCAQAAIKFIVKRWPVISSTSRIPNLSAPTPTPGRWTQGTGAAYDSRMPTKRAFRPTMLPRHSCELQIYERELVAENGHKSIGLVTKSERRSKPTKRANKARAK